MILKRRVHEVYQLKEGLQTMEENSKAINQYLSQLIQYKIKGEKPVLKELLSQFHHIVPLCPYDQFPLLCIIICSSLIIDSEIVFQKVLKNTCRLSLSESCFYIIEILFMSILKNDVYKAGEEQLKELIRLGLNGNDEDKKKSLQLFRSFTHITQECDSLLPFVIQLTDFLIEMTEINKTELLEQFCSQLTLLDQSVVHQVCIHCMEMLKGLSEKQSYNTLFILVQLTQKESLILLSFQYHLLNRLLNDLSLFNSNHYIHSLLLRFYSMLLPFVSLEPVFTHHTWLEEYWKQKEDERMREKQLYEQCIHRILFILF